MSNQIINEKIHYGWLMYLILCFTPLMVSFNGSYVSLNFLYLLILPFTTFFITSSYVLIILVFTISFIFGFFYVTEEFNINNISRIINYIIWCTYFLFIFVKLPFSKRTFFLAIVIASFVYSLFIIYQTYNYNFEFTTDLKKNLREIVPLWPQRYLPVIVSAFFLSFIIIRSNLIKLVLSSFFLFIIYLADTRSANIGLFTCLTIYLFILIHRFNKTTSQILLPLILYTIVLLGFIFLPVLYDYFFNIYLTAVPTAYENFNQVSLFGYAFYNDTSEGRRLLGWLYAFNWLIDNNIFTGSGFIGINSISERSYGSLHSDIIDITFRTGIVGLIIYLSYYFSTLYQLLIRNCNTEFFTLLSLLIYSLFNETTRISVVGQIIFILISFTLNKKRYH